MRVSTINNSQPNFEAKVKLNEMGKLFDCEVKGTTYIDSMLNETKVVKKLSDFSIENRNALIAKLGKNSSKTKILFAKKAHKALRHIRALADKIFLAQNFRAISKLNNSIEQMPTDSKEYIEEIAKVGNTIKKHININDTDNPLNDIAKSGTASIFVLNHPNYHKDKFIYIILNSILNKAYVNEGLQKTCPRPKILVSHNMLKIISQKCGNIYKHLGLTAIDATLGKHDIQGNAVQITRLVKEFTEDKTNIFIFPEGNKSAFTNKKFAERMQKGIAEMVKTATEFKKEVRVVPIGIHYTKEKDCFGNIFVGKPIIFKKVTPTTYDVTEKNGSYNLKLKKPTKAFLNIITKNIEQAIENAKKV